MRGFQAARRLETSFVGRCLRAFLAFEGIDRALVIAAQAFTALIPLLMLVASLTPSDHRGNVGETVVKRFNLSGSAADAVTTLFARPDSTTGAASVASFVLVVFSALAFTRRMQRMYQQAWELPSLGVRGSVDAAMGLAALLLEVAILYLGRSLLRGLPLDRVLQIPVTVAVGTVLWTSVPWLLLDRRLHWRRLLPGGFLAALATSLYGVATSIYMPGTIERYSERFGLFGVTLALIGWLVAISGILVAATVVGAEFDRTQDRWARRLRTRLRLESTSAEAQA